MKKILLASCFFLCSSFVYSSSNHAQSLTFDFESQATGAFPSVVATVDGVTLTATSTKSGGFAHIRDISLPVNMGSRALVGSRTSSLQTNNFTPLRFDFSTLLSSLSLIVGDSGGDDDGTVRIRAYDASNFEIDSDTALHPNNFADTRILTVSAPAISYVIADSFGGLNNLHSVLWDNITVTVIPEPSSIGLLAIGLLCSGLTKRRR